MDRKTYTGLYNAYLQMYYEQRNREDEVNKAATKELSKMGWKGNNDDPVITKLKRKEGNTKDSITRVGGSRTAYRPSRRGGHASRSIRRGDPNMD
jgi:hypothetical protein